MRKDLPGPRRKKLLLTSSTGFYTTEGGLRRRKSVRGHSVATDTVQINMKIVSQGPKAVEELVPKKEEKKK
jgi:small subunit ribosomal protein S6e